MGNPMMGKGGPMMGNPMMGGPQMGKGGPQMGNPMMGMMNPQQMMMMQQKGGAQMMQQKGGAPMMGMMRPPMPMQGGPQGARPAAPQQQQPPAQPQFNASTLAAAPPQIQKQMIGEKLYPLIAKIEPQMAGKVTGMMLEMDNSELLMLLESEQQLRSKVTEAIQVLSQK